MVDTKSAALLTKLFENAAPLRPLETDLASLRDRGMMPQVGALHVQLGFEESGPTAQAWIFDGEGRGTTAHSQLERSKRMAGPEHCAVALQVHLLARAPLVLANKIQIAWTASLDEPDRYEVRFHNTNGRIAHETVAQLADTFGAVVEILSAFSYGKRTYSIEPTNGVGTRTVVAANPTEAAQFWMVMESLNPLRVRPVEPPAWVVETHDMHSIASCLRAFGDTLPDLRTAHRR